jgi:catechol 2,3-dioxygenase-like lactoylglutathione lyase family enzyme
MIDRFDHLVLTVTDIPRSVDFYQRVLDMRYQPRGRGPDAMLFGRQKINLHQVGHEFEPKATRPLPGAIDLCLITRWSMDRLLAHLAKQGVEVEEGPVLRNGALGPMESVYFRDPDGNLLEISRYLEQPR